MIKGVIFDLGNTLLYLERDWNLLETEQNHALMQFLKENGIPVGEDFPALLRAARADGWKLAEQTAIEHTVEEALATVLAQPAYQKTETGSPANPKPVNAMRSVPFPALSDAASGHAPLNGLIPRAVAAYFGAGEVYWRLYPGAIETCRALHSRGVRVGLISNADDDGVVQRAVVRTGLAAYADPILSSAGMKWRKPSPEIFRYVANAWRLRPEEIAMVGDAPKYDIVGAHNAGMHGILIDRHEGHAWQQIPAESADAPGIQPDATVGNLLEIPDLIQTL